MTYEMFKKELKTSLEEKLGSDACITFGKKPMLGETMDTVHIRAEKSNLDYSLSMEALYHLSSVGGLDAEHAADMILEILASIPANRLSLDTGNIICQLMSRSRISTRLDQIPHIPFYDMEITFACVVEDAEIRKSMLIDNEMMEQSHLSLQQLFDLAHRNTFRMFPRHRTGICCHSMGKKSGYGRYQGVGKGRSAEWRRRNPYTPYLLLPERYWQA